MNIWYFHHYATPTTVAGLHRPFEFAKYFIRDNNNVVVFSSSFLHYVGQNMITDKKKYLIEKYDGVETVYIRTCGYNNSGIMRIKNMCDYYSRLIRVAKKYSKLYGAPDIIIASSPHPLTMIAGIKLGKYYGVPCISEIRDFWPEVFFTSGRLKKNSLLGKILLQGEKLIYTRSDALVVLKEGDHQYILEQGWDTDHGGSVDMKKCYYINNGVDIALFDKNAEENKLSDDDLDNKSFKIVYCGAMRPINHVDVLVDVGKILGNSAEILIYGTGNCVSDIEKEISEKRVTNVKLKGYIDNKYVPYILSKSSLNILNYSSTEYNWSRGNSSNKLFEYLASGKPVVSTVKMGYDILERYSCGVSSEGCIPELIAEAISKIQKLSSEEYAKYCARARIAAGNFDIKKLSCEYLNLIKEEIHRRNSI